MNPGNQTVSFSMKRKTSGQDSLSKHIQLWNATCKGLFWSLILSASWFSCHEAAEIHTVTYVCACVQFTSLRNPEYPKGPLTSVWRQRALPFNNTCYSSERLDEDHYALHSHDPYLQCLMSWNVFLSLSLSADSFKQISLHINKMTIYRPK